MEKILQSKIDYYLAHEEDPKFIAEIEKLLKENNTDELNDRFYRDLEFGTAGLRGIIAGGLNRMNGVVIRKTTQGLANYLNKTYNNKASAAIAYDCRHYSLEFAQMTAAILAENGIKVYLFSTIHPTPALAYATVYYKATVGIMLTASHNPAEYNGYKVFQYDGSQIVSPADKDILKAIEECEVPKSANYAELLKQGMITIIPEELDKSYFEMALRTIDIPFIKANNQKLKIVYTPLHGTGTAYVEYLFNYLGLNFLTVKEQREGDGNFPTVSYPNPEDPAGLAMALDLAKKEQADLVLATDPDSDRLAVAYLCPKTSSYVTFNGHQMGALLADYLLQRAKNSGKNLANYFVAKSIVTSELEKRLVEDYGATCFNVLTGFKWIANAVRVEEAKGKDGLEFLFGNEEAIGYLVEKAIRDKDGVTAALVVSEMFLYYQQQGKSLGDRLTEIYTQYGFYNDSQISKTYPGEEGAKIMQKLMTTLRNDGLKTIGNQAVKEVYDYELGTIKDGSGAVTAKLDYEKSNVLQFYTENGSRLSVRPSGTEPKIKFYISSRTDYADYEKNAKLALTFHEDVEKLITTLTK